MNRNDGIRQHAELLTDELITCTSDILFSTPATHYEIQVSYHRIVCIQTDRVNTIKTKTTPHMNMKFATYYCKIRRGAKYIGSSRVITALKRLVDRINTVGGCWRKVFVVSRL